MFVGGVVIGDGVTKDPNKIIAAVKRGHQVLDSIH
jgi:hypothetical protein